MNTGAHSSKMMSHALTRGDYRRPAGEAFTPWPHAGEGKRLK